MIRGGGGESAERLKLGLAFSQTKPNTPALSLRDSALCWALFGVPCFLEKSVEGTCGWLPDIVPAESSKSYAGSKILQSAICNV